MRIYLIIIKLLQNIKKLLLKAEFFKYFFSSFMRHRTEICSTALNGLIR